MTQRLVLCCLAGFALLIVVGCSTDTEQRHNAQSLTIERIFDDPDLSGPAPRGLKISPDGARVTFLRGKDTDKNQLDLWEYNIDEGSSRMLVDSIALQPTQELLSEEEKSRRERQRISSYHGIVEYQWSEDGNWLLFPLSGDVYVYDLAAPDGNRVRRLIETEAFETDFRFSPDSKYVAFIRDKDLYVVSLHNGRQLRRDLKHLPNGFTGCVLCGDLSITIPETCFRLFSPDSAIGPIQFIPLEFIVGID